MVGAADVLRDGVVFEVPRVLKTRLLVATWLVRTWPNPPPLVRRAAAKDAKKRAAEQE